MLFKRHKLFLGYGVLGLALELELADLVFQSADLKFLGVSLLKVEARRLIDVVSLGVLLPRHHLFDHRALFLTTSARLRLYNWYFKIGYGLHLCLEKQVLVVLRAAS